MSHCLIALLLLASPFLRAQQPNGVVRGAVLDQGGRPVEGAAILLKSGTGPRRTSSNSAGQFEFLRVAPGTYELITQAAGFRTVTRPQLLLNGAGLAEVEVRLDADTALSGPFALKESVEVTATRSTLGTEQSPASSVVIRRSDMDRRNIVAVDQAVNAVEGVYSYRVRGVPDNEIGIGMRGFSGRGTGQNRILVLLDGQPVNNSYSGAVNFTALPLGELERVEVARGPFSSLYGGNAMGGVVNLITRPITQRTAEFGAQFGTYGTTNYSGRVGQRFKERLGLSFGFDGLRTDGYRSQEVLRTATDSTPTGGTQVTGIQRFLTRTGTVNYGVGLRGENNYERLAFRGRAEYSINSRTFASFQYLRQSNNYGWGPYENWVKAADGRLIDNGNVVFQEDGRWRRITLAPTNYLGVVGEGNSSVYQGQLLWGSNDDGQWRFQGGINDIPRDSSGTPGTAANFAGGAGTETLQASRGGFANVQWSHTLRARHAVSVGSDMRLDSATIGVFPTSQYLGDGTVGPRSTFTRGAAATWAVYAQDQYAVAERFTVTFGGRYDNWRTYNGQSQPADNAPTSPFPDRSAGAFTGKIAAVYTIRSGSVLRASIGSAFRPPSVFDLYRDLRLSSGSLLLGNANLTPERMSSWEFGIRQDVTRIASLDIAYYENHIRDMIFRSIDIAADPTGLTQRMLNAGRARTRGVETALTLRPFSWLTLRPTYTYTDPRITRNNPAPLTVGRQIPFVPRHSSGGTISAVWKRIAITNTGRYQAPVFSADTNNDTTKGVPGAYDGFVEFDSAVNVNVTKMITGTFTVENLFNRQYYLFYRNPGRTVSAGLRFRLKGSGR